MDNLSSEVNSKTVLILGNFSLESVEDKIVALGYTFQKSLDGSQTRYGSQPSDWLKNEKDNKRLFSLREVLAVFLFLSDSAVVECSTSEYLDYWHNLLLKMKEHPALIFIEEDCFRENTFLTHEDEMLDRCLHFFNRNLELIKEFLSNKEVTLDNNFVDHLMIDISNHSISLNFERVHEAGSEVGGSLVTLRDKDTVAFDLFLQAQHLLQEIKTARSDIDSIIAIKFHKKSFKQLKTKKEKIESLLGRFHSDFVKKQTEQLQQVKQLLKILVESGVEIVPYKERKAISLRVHHFLDEIDKGIILHLYVPNGRYQEDQLSSFLRLFESYLQRVEKLQFFIDTRKTLHGQIYEFKSTNKVINSSDMEVAFSRFESFMSLCQNDQKQAEALLLRKGINPSEATRLMTRYVKEYQRLLLDIEHERERKFLDLRQRFESETLELTHNSNIAVSQSVQPIALLSLPNNLDPLSITISNSSVIINPGIQSYVEQAIYGDIHYNTEDKELLRLFERYAERLESVILRSELEQLKDTSSSEAERKTAKQKIAFFLSKVAPAIGQSALTVLTAYLEKVLIGS